MVVENQIDYFREVFEEVTKMNMEKVWIFRVIQLCKNHMQITLWRRHGRTGKLS